MIGERGVADNYLKSIELAFQGEVYGETLYEALAQTLSDPDQRHKWQVLAQMERETKASMRELVARHGGTTVELQYWRDQAMLDLKKYVDLPWLELMRVFSDELTADIDEYAELESGCPSGDAEILHRLTGHEVVTKQFCDLELQGRGDISIAPVVAFCAVQALR